MKPKPVTKSKVKPVNHVTVQSVDVTPEATFTVRLSDGSLLDEVTNVAHKKVYDGLVMTFEIYRKTTTTPISGK